LKPFTITNIIGARPQFIKYAPVQSAFKRLSQELGVTISDILIHTGQHYDYEMSRVFFDELEIKEPAFHLGVGSGLHGHQTALILQKTEEVLLKERPDVVMVYGDTNTTVAGALAAAKLHIPVAHVEAGLRSFNKRMPEEVNRVMTDHLSTLLLCPSATAVANLQREGFTRIAGEGTLLNEPHVPDPGEIDASSPLVINTGDLMYDVLLQSTKIVDKRSGVLSRLQLRPKQYALMTLHRAENTDSSEAFSKIIFWINKNAASMPVVFPMHPRTRKAYESLSPRFSNGVEIIEPQGYFNLLQLLKNAALVFTDSGGMQKEAFWLQVPCVTMREETEWTETVDSGWNILMRNYSGSHLRQTGHPDVYGDGHAADRIVRQTVTLFGN